MFKLALAKIDSDVILTTIEYNGRRAFVFSFYPLCVHIGNVEFGDSPDDYYRSVKDKVKMICDYLEKNGRSEN